MSCHERGIVVKQDYSFELDAASVAGSSDKHNEKCKPTLKQQQACDAVAATACHASATGRRILSTVRLSSLSQDCIIERRSGPKGVDKQDRLRMILVASFKTASNENKSE